MKLQEIQESIRDLNLTYLMLAQQMIKKNRAAAIFRLGISQDLADMISSLSPAQVVKMSNSDALLCRFRFNEKVLLNMVTSYNKNRLMGQAHAAIMMANQDVEELA